MRRLYSTLIWIAVSLLGAAALARLALSRGESISAGWLLAAALCCYAVGYRFYARMIATKIFVVDDRRATPAVRMEDGRDYLPTNRWVVFGHHFAAIAGPGPLVGPTLAAQFGFLPGAIWIVVGVVLGGAVQDFVILLASVRRNGRSLGAMARDEIGPVAGTTALVAILGIMVVLIAVLALVVVNALAASPWGVVTIALTIPIALLMGVLLRWVRPGRVLEVSAIGLVLLVGSLYAGRWVAANPEMAAHFTLSRQTLAIGIIVVLPPLQMPALTRFAHGGGPIFAGTIFPFAFITIACGAISGFHALIASGTTPKLLARESDALLVGYGGMLMESFVAIMALIAACLLTPGVYFAINASSASLGPTVESAAHAIAQWGFTVTPQEMRDLASRVGEISLLSRTGGAPSLAVGMAHLFSNVLGGSGAMALWYHFAIMFEALFILTTIDAGTRVGRFMLQDLGGLAWSPLGKISSYPATVMSSAVFVGMWGYFLYQGVTDPLGGINSLWPLFGISNQLLAAVALCVGTTVIIKMGRARYAWVTVMPLTWLAIVTLTAGHQKIWSPDPALGFLAHARLLRDAANGGVLPPGVASAAAAARMALNDRLDAGVASFFIVCVIVVLVASMREWWLVLSGRKVRITTEIPFEAAATAVSAR